MKLTYTGKLEKLDTANQRKLDARVGRLSKMLDGKEERRAHVILGKERHLHRAEVTTNYYDHPVVGLASSEEQFTAFLQACDKLEKQIVKLKTKWRDTKRSEGPVLKGTVPGLAEKNGSGDVTQGRVRAGRVLRKKPMGAEEAVLEMTAKRDYVAYYDQDSGKLSVLVRCRDGNLDLIET